MRSHDDQARTELVGASTGNCLRAAIALEEAGIPYIARHVDLAHGEQLTPAHIALNPAGKVPVLIAPRPSGDALVLTQSNAIMLYAAGQSSDNLMPRVEDAQGPIAYERFFYFMTDVIAPSHAGFALFRCNMKEAAAAMAQQSLVALSAGERFVERSRYMAGEHFTLADIAALTMVRFREADLDWSRLPRMRDWYTQMLARSGVQRGLRAFDRPTDAMG